MPESKRRFSTALLAFVCGASALAFGAEPWPLWDGAETIEHYAQRANLPPTKTLELGNGVKLELVLIPAGEFIMGTPEPEKPIVGQAMVAAGAGIALVLLLVVLARAWKKHSRPQVSLAFLLLLTLLASIGVWGGVRWYAALQTEQGVDEFPAHKVTLTQPFYMGRFEVTQEQYQQVTGETPSQFKGRNLPVDTVSRNDAREFCRNVNKLIGQTVRLPTEAEWEYSCRGGKGTLYCAGDTEADLDRVAWYSRNSVESTHPVGMKDANAWGVHDMHGNVSEWCNDWYVRYTAEAQLDPHGPSRGSEYVLRGGSWFSRARRCRATLRFAFADCRTYFFGFRVVVEVPKRP